MIGSGRSFMERQYSRRRFLQMGGAGLLAGAGLLGAAGCGGGTSTASACRTMCCAAYTATTPGV